MPREEVLLRTANPWEQFTLNDVDDEDNFWSDAEDDDNTAPNPETDKDDIFNRDRVGKIRQQHVQLEEEAAAARKEIEDPTFTNVFADGIKESMTAFNIMFTGYPQGYYVPPPRHSETTDALLQMVKERHLEKVADSEQSISPSKQGNKKKGTVEVIETASKTQQKAIRNKFALAARAQLANIQEKRAEEEVKTGSKKNKMLGVFELARLEARRKKMGDGGSRRNLFSSVKDEADDQHITGLAQNLAVKRNEHIAVALVDRNRVLFGK